MNKKELWKWGAVKIAKAVINKKITAEEVIISNIKRRKAINPLLNAVVIEMDQQALKKAKNLDEKIKNGKKVGFLAGVPITIKENVDVKNQSTTNGMKSFLSVVAKKNSPVVENLLNQDAIIIGRTNTPEISYRWFTDNPLRGLTYNPWSRNLTPGGSSGGAASSVAMGIGAIAHGNDVGGSIRYPAYACGITGIKPSLGRVPAFNPSAPKERSIGLQLMSVQGPHARTIGDLEIALKAMSLDGKNDPWWIKNIEEKTLNRNITIAFNKWAGGKVCNKRVLNAIDLTANIFRENGFKVVNKTPPSIADAAECWRIIFGFEAKVSMLPLVKKIGSKAIINVVSGFVDQGNNPKIEDYFNALAKRNKIIRIWNEFMEKYPVIISPVSASLPYQQNEDQKSKKRLSEIIQEQSPLYVTNLLGLPSLAVPTEVVNDTPVGIQITTSRFQESLAIKMGKIVEKNVGTFYEKLWEKYK